MDWNWGIHISAGPGIVVTDTHTDRQTQLTAITLVHMH